MHKGKGFIIERNHIILLWKYDELFLDLGEKDSGSDVLVIPTEGVVELSGAEGLSIDLNVVEIFGVFCGSLKPSSTPQKLILQIIFITIFLNPLFFFLKKV